MEPYDQNIRRLIVEERIEQLAFDRRSASRDGRRRGRLHLREVLGAAAHRRPRKAQLSGR
jgi:hypothetical protein